MNHIGKKARGGRHIVELQESSELKRVNISRIEKQLREAENAFQFACAFLDADIAKFFIIILSIIFMLNSMALAGGKDKGKNKTKPPGWEQGEKTGWDGEDAPPGLRQEKLEKKNKAQKMENRSKDKAKNKGKKAKHEAELEKEKAEQEAELEKEREAEIKKEKKKIKSKSNKKKG